MFSPSFAQGAVLPFPAEILPSSPLLKILILITMPNLAGHQVKFILPAGILPASAQFLAAELVQNDIHHYDFNKVIH